MSEFLQSWLLKVDGVAAPAEAAALVAAGATIIGVDLAGGGAEAGSRRVSPEAARAVRGPLGGARLCVTLDNAAEDAATALAAAHAAGADLVQVPAHSAARNEWREAILDAGLPVLLDGEEVSYEDDPAWIALRLDRARAWGAALMQIRLLGDIRDPWTHLTQEAPRSPRDYIQLDDLRRMTQTYPALVSMQVTPAEIPALRAALPASRGMFFRLGNEGEIGPVLALLEGLRQPA